MALQLGDAVPHFASHSADGSLFDSNDYLGKKPLVIYFYPKDNTRVCTIQACSFRDQYEDFKAYGAEVIGISSDGSQAHQKFAKQHQLPFILLSDSGKQLRKLFGVPNDLMGLIPGRVTYVIDKKGIVQLIFDSMSGPIHIQKALECIRKLT
ncbi:MAG: peroxiredoxin [Flavobacterium sp.]|nr:peroxiredoxin [Flavobacterium sp.]